MVDAQLAGQRLVAQGLIEPRHGSVTEVVSAFGAMQGQDLSGVIASVALRLPVADPALVVDAFDAGEIVRGYPMRGTVFAVPAADVTWMTQLCAGAPRRAMIARRAALGLDDAVVDRARELLLEFLGGAPRGASRSQVVALWDKTLPDLDRQHTYHLLRLFMHESLICWGPWNGTDQNVVANESWLPVVQSLEHRFNGDEVAACAVLLERYLLSHGPATLRDFAWWSKLPLRTIRAALPLISDRFERDGAEESSWWRPGLHDDLEAVGKLADQPLLLPGFDEFILGYPDRQFAMTAHQESLLVPGNNGVFRRAAVAEAVVKGFWKRDGRAGKRILLVEPFNKPLVRHHKGWERRFRDYPFLTP